MRLQESLFAFIITSLVILVILSLGGCPPPSPQEEAASPRGFVLPAGDAARGKEAFVALRCSSCHQVAGLEDELPRPTANPQTGIELGGLAMREPTDGELVTSIINPSHQISPAAPPGEEERVLSGSGSRMANLNEVMTAQQLIDIVAFLHEVYETRPE